MSNALTYADEVLALNDIDVEKLDLLERAVEAADARGTTPSAAARTATRLATTLVDEVTLHDAYRLLPLLVSGGYAHTSGNGMRTRYHAGRTR